MIYLTGDTHGGIDMRKLMNEVLEANDIHIQKGDYLIITGDFGFPFSPSDIEAYRKCKDPFGVSHWIDREYTYWIEWLCKQPYTILFVDGNHDNHEWWTKQEVSEMFGGKVQVHPHASNVIHLMRGEVYAIEEKTFFTFGGAVSTDKEWRTEGVSWWPGEEASEEEMERARTNLKKVDCSVDYIVTHTLPMQVIKSIPMFYHKTVPCKTASFLDEVYESVDYDMWFCGHFHTSMPIYDDRVFVLYNSVTALKDFEKILNED